MFAAEMLMLSLIKVSLLLALSPVNFFIYIKCVRMCWNNVCGKGYKLVSSLGNG